LSSAPVGAAAFATTQPDAGLKVTGYQLAAASGRICNQQENSTTQIVFYPS
jgi:hypothetical protein